MRRKTILLPAAIMWFAGTAIADEPRPSEFGTQGTNVLHIPALTFPFASPVEVDYDTGFVSVSNGFSIAPVILPSGARIVGLAAYVDDSEPPADLFVVLRRYTGFPTVTSTDLATISTAGLPPPGKVRLFQSVDETVENDLSTGGSQYLVLVSMGGFCTGVPPCLHFKGVDILWKRQISPAPATATIGDVPANHPYFRAIEALAASGITGGCGGGNFCPGGNVTRGEMAAFLARALGLQWTN